ncbi:MAG: 30S ribosomal protein S20 [Candidatus Puniceispirillum sp.]|nr:30S ribosomal protein S20 [Candidatus Pelagibacter sp.]MBA4283231.1 30S ribosomal protein S20 [Candidatus Puniceispirillum sp.]
MPSHKSAEKCVRKIARQTLVNRNRVSKIRTTTKKVENMIEQPQKAETTVLVAAFRECQKQIMKGVTKGLVHKNTAMRKVSRLAKKIKALATS